MGSQGLRGGVDLGLMFSEEGTAEERRLECSVTLRVSGWAGFPIPEGVEE